MKPAEIRFFLQKPQHHRGPTMAPTVGATMTFPQEHLTLTHKLRKPLVEKLRRERINSSIEQLKSLLSPEFLKQQPDSKLEKADILEMTVNVLVQLLQQNRQQKSLPKTLSDSRDADFSPLSPTAHTRFIKEIPANSALWRPW